jgi:hypothetical protein
MNVIGVLDTNIVVDFLLGRPEALREMRRYERRAISLITWIEVLAGARDDVEESALEGVLAQFEVLGIGIEVAGLAARLRRTRRIRLPDALIWASATQAGGLLVTRNTRDFPENEPGIRIPYRI